MDRPWPTSTHGAPSSRRKSWRIQRAVIHALFLREMKTRFGSKRFGYFWAILEPATMVLIFWVMFGLALRGNSAVQGIVFPMFFFTGYMPYAFFRTTVNACMNAFGGNRGLFNYRQVKPLDTLVSRCLVECFIHLIVFCILVSLGIIIGFDAAIHDFLGLSLLLLLLVWFSLSLGLVFAVIGTFSETFIKVVSFVMRPMFFLSGIFFSISRFPPKLQGVLLFNPMLNINELVRVHYFANYQSPSASYAYVFYCTVILCFLGLWLYSRLENRIILSL